MERTSYFFCIIMCIILLTECSKKEEDPIKFKQGTFPDSVINLGNINSQFDDYNLSGSSPLIFSSNRGSQGGQFDLVQGDVSFTFDQTTGKFDFTTSVTNDAFLANLIQKAVTPRNDFGPYRIFSNTDGYDYMIISSVNDQGNLDLFYLKNRPKSGSSLPEIQGPLPVSILNTTSDDAYFCFDTNQDTAYFCSNRNGNFDILLINKPSTTDHAAWFNQGFAAAVPVDSLNSTADDKCPMIMKKIMVFTSNRPGGLGGYDLYYSVFRKGKWGSPVNFGPGINTSSDEYRPVLGSDKNFTNYFLMFSSNKPGGKGGFDLYFTGVKI